MTVNDHVLGLKPRSGAASRTNQLLNSGATMNKEQLQKANKIANQIKAVTKELEIWQRDLDGKAQLGYLQKWNNNHATKLETNISDGVFNGFRCAAMDNLKLKLISLEQDLAGI